MIDRTGELLLQTSALHAVDGDAGTFWMNPPGDLPQSMTIELPSRTRISRIGVQTEANGGFTANHVTFASSIDGRTFTPVMTIKAKDANDVQWFDVRPFEATLVRISIDDALLAGHDVRLRSVLADGDALAPPAGGNITGCWKINGEPAQFRLDGGHVTGILAAGKAPLHFDGGFDRLIYRLQWVRGNDYGLSLITVSPDGQHLSGLNWHEEAIPMFFDTSWYGERAPCGIALPGFDVPVAYAKRTGRFALYDSSQLPRLMKTFPGATFVAHEFRFADAAKNLAAARQALAALHVTGVAQGIASPRQVPTTDIMRALYSTVDFEIRR
ncbi:MAG TPA: discoidin domain-containing protein [Thermoanaerobaculia bacterium]|nr:discoidin domain-containing protein [Thermoanaerobaculia bacterium]